MILITGVTGTTGIEVANLIARTKVKVRALVRDLSSAVFIQKMGIETVQGNLENPDSIRRAINGIQKVFLLTADNPKQVEQEKNLIDVSYEANVRHIVKFSIIGADVNSNCNILKHHSASEIYLKNSKLNYTHIRPNLLMQNFLMFAKIIKKKGEFYCPFQKAKCGFVDVKDVAKVIVKILLDENFEKYNRQTYTLTGPDLLSCKEVAEILSTFMNKRISYIKVSTEEFTQVLNKLKFEKYIAEDYSNLYSLAVEGLFDKKTEDIFEITGSQPANFENFVLENIKYFN